MEQLFLGASLQRYAPNYSQTPHSHDEPTITLVLSGSIRERACRSDVVGGPLSLVVKPAGVVHANLFGPEPVVTCQLRLDPTIHDGSRWRDALTGWRWLMGGPAVRAGLLLAREVWAGRAATRSDAIDEAAIAVLAALDPERANRHPPAWLERVTSYLEDEVASGASSVRVSAAASVVGVHPVHLTRVFRGHHGCTVSEFVRRRRAQYVAIRAAGPGGFSALAHAAGFADHSHMNRVFRRETGLLPRELHELTASVRNV